MAKYSQEFKLEVVQYYFDTGYGRYLVAQHFGIYHSIVQKWIDIYNIHGEDGFKRRANKSYDLDFRLDIMRALTEEGLSFSEFLKRFKLKEVGMISNWLHRYKEHGIDGLKPKPRGRAKSMSKPQRPRIKYAQEDYNKTQEQLLEELAYLRAEVAYLKKRRALIQKQQEQEKAEQQRLQDSYLN